MSRFSTHYLKTRVCFRFFSSVSIGLKCKCRNYLFEIPVYNKHLFVKDARKIVPSLTTDDIYYAAGFGGVRPQVLNKTEKRLMLGEASINTGKGIIFNMTPSPGATCCLGNGERDTRFICEYLGAKFDEEKFNQELVD